MYEIWLAMNIAFEIAWDLWPALLPLALVWAVVMLINRKKLALVSASTLAALAVLVALAAVLALPSLSKNLNLFATISAPILLLVRGKGLHHVCVWTLTSLPSLSGLQASQPQATDSASTVCLSLFKVTILSCIACATDKIS